MRKFTKFENHEDNVNETIKASDINKIQRGINKNEKNIIENDMQQFYDIVNFQLLNNMFVNSVFMDNFCKGIEIDMSTSNNITFNGNSENLELINQKERGNVTTLKQISIYGDQVNLNDFYIITNEEKPIGSKIKYKIILDDIKEFPINANDVNNPCHFIEPTNSFKINIEMIPSINGETPMLYGYAVLYYDEEVENSYGIQYPDLSRINKLQVGLTTLYRDKALEDKLVKVDTPNEEIFLNYDIANDKLSNIVTKNKNDNSITTDTLNYGNYINSNNEDENVLLSILSKKNN